MLQNTMNHSGKAAVFVRGFMTEFWKRQRAADEKGTEAIIPLRVCQDAGLAAVQELGEDISVPYVSKLARQIASDGLVSKKKKGRKFYLSDTSDTELFMDWLQGRPDWGVDIRSDEDNEIRQRMDIIEFMKEHRGVVIHPEHQLPKAQYSFLMKKFAEGKLKMVLMYEEDDAYRMGPQDQMATQLVEFWDERNYD